MKIIPLSKNKVAIVSNLDFKMLSKYTWHCSNVGYAQRNALKSEPKSPGLILMHRQIMEAPKNLEVDHRNGNKLDNRRRNLRMATPQQNRCNRGKQKNNKTGFKGVSLYKATGKYVSEIWRNRKKFFLGYFNSPEEACVAYRKASKKIHGRFGKSN